MTLAADTLKMIADDQYAKDLNGQIATVSLHTAVLIPEGYKLQSLEQYQATRDRFKGNFTTDNLNDFCSLCHSTSISYPSMFY